MKSKRLIEKTWFRMLPLILGGILLLLIAAGAAVAIRWRMSAKEAADPVLLGEPVYEFAGGEPAIGARFSAVLLRSDRAILWSMFRPPQKNTDRCRILFVVIQYIDRYNPCKGKHRKNRSEDRVFSQNDLEEERR